MVNIPKYTMGEQFVDFAPVTNALAAYRDQGNKNRAFDQNERQFGAQNALAQAQLGIQKQAAARAEQMAPLQLRQMEAQIDAMRRQGATEAQLAPLKMAQMQAHTELYQAQAQQARQKDVLSQSIAEMINHQGQGGGAPQMPPQMPPQQQNPIRPQSFDGGGADPMFIQTQAGGQAMPQQQPDMIDTPLGRMTPQEAQRKALALGLAGKGDAGKILLESANANKLGKEARNKVDEKEFGAVESLARVKEIARGFKPEYLTIEGKARQYGISWLDSFDATRKSLPPEVLAEHSNYVSFRRDAVSNMNQYIKEMTGAAMSELEANRLRKAIADAENDGPTAFATKLKGAAREAEMTIARMRFLRNNGFTGDANAAAARMPIPQFQRMIQQDTNQLYQQLRQANPSADDGQIKSQVRQQIRAKFGLDT